MTLQELIELAGKDEAWKDKYNYKTKDVCLEAVNEHLERIEKLTN